MGLLTKIKLFIAFLIGIKSGTILDSLEDKKLDLSAFSTKTAYRYCGLTPFNDGTLQKLDSCKPIHINGIYRHGTRAPSLKDVQRVRDLRAKLLSSENVMLPSGFRDYPVPFANETDRGLLPRGLEELHSLGQRIRNRMPPWFESTDGIKFYTSSSSRAILSARSFYHGLFNLTPLDAQNTWDAELHLNALPETIQIADRFTRLFESCKRYATEIGKNKSALEEHFKFIDGAEMKEAFKEIMSRNRLPASKFSTGDIYIMFRICGYEIAVFSNDQSPWCGFLRKNYQPVLEYILDLKHYWLRAYGRELNYIHACPLVAEMLREIREAALSYKRNNFNISHAGVHRASFWFGHAETVLPVTTLLGLFNDSVGKEESEILYADAFNGWLSRVRTSPPLPTTFRAGHIIPFAGNLMLELYHCPNEVSPQGGDPLAGFFVLPRVNNQTVAWPLASPVQPPTSKSPGAPFAPLSSVLNYFKACTPDAYDEEKHCNLD